MSSSAAGIDEQFGRELLMQRTQFGGLVENAEQIVEDARNAPVLKEAQETLHACQTALAEVKKRQSELQDDLMRLHQSRDQKKQDAKDLERQFALLKEPLSRRHVESSTERVLVQLGQKIVFKIGRQ